MVYHEELWGAGGPFATWILPAGEGGVCGYSAALVCLCLFIRLLQTSQPSLSIRNNENRGICAKKNHSTIFVVYLILSLISLYPTASHRASVSSKRSDPESQSHPWEMMQVPPTPGATGGLKSPTTPRTMAFQTLGGERKAGKARGKGKGKEAAPLVEGQQTRVGGGSGGLPLRHHISMGAETYEGQGKGVYT